MMCSARGYQETRTPKVTRSPSDKEIPIRANMNELRVVRSIICYQKTIPIVLTESMTRRQVRHSPGQSIIRYRSEEHETFSLACIKFPINQSSPQKMYCVNKSATPPRTNSQYSLRSPKKSRESTWPLHNSLESPLQVFHPRRLSNARKKNARKTPAAAVPWHKVRGPLSAL